MSAPAEKPKTPDELSSEQEAAPPKSPEARQLELEAAILDELRRMNRLLYAITYGPRRYTLSFFSGITRGLGALLGATVVFALLIGLLSRLNTVPLIGGYVTQVLSFVQHQVSMPQQQNGTTPKATDTPAPTPTP